MNKLKISELSIFNKQNIHIFLAWYKIFCIFWSIIFSGKGYAIKLFQQVNIDGLAGGGSCVLKASLSMLPWVHVIL